MSRWLRIRIVIDRVIAALLLVSAAPLLAVLGLLVRRDGGPPFIRVPRVGQEGRPLEMWKVRSMRAEGAGGLAGGGDLTAGNDSRVTPVGRWLRRFRVDELPQLVNVLRGEMALIGPRPEAPAYVDVDDDAWQRILQAPPGIAGITQVLVNRWEAQTLREATSEDVYRAEILPVKVAIDAWYVAYASPLIDAHILLAVVSQRDAWLRQRVSHLGVVDRVAGA